MQAYILITTEATRVWDVTEAMLKIDGVRMAHAVTGSYDVISFVEALELDALGYILSKILAIRGVLHTQTAIVMPEKL